MTPSKFFGAAAIALAVCACGGKDDSSSTTLQNVPDAAALALEVQGGAAEALSAENPDLSVAAAGPQAAAAAQLATVPSTGDDLAKGRERIAAVNEAIRTFLGHIEAVATENGVPAPGSTTVYGPVDRCVVASPCDARFGHLAYQPAVGGRAYAVVKNYALGGTWHGDVPTAGTDDHYFLGRACYLPGQTTPAYKEWFSCERGTGPAACILAAAGVGTRDTSIASGSWQTSCPTAASELDAPQAEPASAADASDEQGEDSAGPTSETPPADAGDTEPPSA